jgi:hypothetical protein
VKELDRETHGSHALLVKATEDCIHLPANQSAFDPSDDTLLKVTVTVSDINDNAPRFVKRVFTGGVTTEADFGTEFMQVKVNSFIPQFKNSIPYIPVTKCIMQLKSLRGLATAFWN